MMEPGSQQLVVLVEDNPDEIMLAQRAFKKSGFAGKLVVLEDGVEALDYLFGQGKYTDRDMDIQPVVILLDLKLPRLNGLEVLQRIKTHAETRLIPVVVLTSSLEQNEMLKSYGLGANSYIRKPVAYERFSEMVQELGLYWLELNEPLRK